MAHCLFIEGQPSHVFAEGFLADEEAPSDLLDIVHDFERLHGTEIKLFDGRVSVPFLNVSGKAITTLDGLDEDDMKVVRMRIRSLPKNGAAITTTIAPAIRRAVRSVNFRARKISMSSCSVSLIS